MIEVNLLPGGKKRAPRGKRLAIPLPKFEKLPQDPWVLGAIAAGVLVVVVAAWLFLSIGGRREEVQVALDQALADSARYSAQIERTNTLMASRDSIVQRVAIIQEIDKGRYVWPHILDEVSRALPDYTWVVELAQIVGGPEPRIRVVGRSGSIEAITVFMDQLEASPFLRNVTTLGTTEQVQQGQLVFHFELEIAYEQPPVEFLDTEPLLTTLGEQPLPANGAEPLPTDGAAPATDTLQSPPGA